MAEHGSVRLEEQFRTDLNNEVGTNADEIGVVGGVVDFAKRQAIGHNRFSRWLSVRDDMGGIEQFGMMQAANGTAFRIGVKHTRPKDGLMQSRHREAGYVGTLEHAELRQVEHALVFIESNHELVRDDIFFFQPDRIVREVHAFADADEVRERQTRFHGRAKGAIV